MKIKIYSIRERGIGWYAQRKNRKIQAIRYPHQEALVKRASPLFYWAWGLSTINIELLYRHFDVVFPRRQHEGTTVNMLMRDQLPLTSVAGTTIWNIKLEQGSTYCQVVPGGVSCIALVLQGYGCLYNPTNGQPFQLMHGDFAIIEAEQPTELIFEAEKDGMQTLFFELSEENNRSSLH
ncbi:hypothetical protein [Paenibacillus aestuarii]|uniref:Uncharacterized protein n=1 Tax=Paenibacillus aestuarii TaxID=516965 RepID=A0ABW0KA75_9BACL|nr:hypothetical protein [Paenibacillus aestuarii]